MNTIISASSSRGPLADISISTLRVADHRNDDQYCENNGTEYTVQVQEIAPGLLVLPTLVCTVCGTQLSVQVIS